MLDVKQFMFAIDQIAEEKNISKDRIVEVIEQAIAAAYKKDYGTRNQMLKAKLDGDAGTFQIFQHRKVVTTFEEEVENEEGEKEMVMYINLPEEEKFDEEGEERRVRYNDEKYITLEEAKTIESGISEGEEIVDELDAHDDFGRVAAQTAKQVVMQRIREIERETIYEAFQDKIGEIVTGTVQRIDRGIVYVDIGRATALLFPGDQVNADNYRVGNRYKFFVQNVEQTDRDPNILITRRSLDFVNKLFSLEVPEIFTGTVQVMAIAREPGVRTKIAVKATQEGIDPVGACVGQRGTRVQSIINELGGEKIDIVEYAESLPEFITRAIAPAKVVSMELDEENNEVQVTVPDDQLSLAIGGGGQNVRLASQLTGYNIDLTGESGKDAGKKKEDTPAPAPAPEAEEAPTEAPSEASSEEAPAEEVVEAPAESTEEPKTE